MGAETFRGDTLGTQALMLGEGPTYDPRSDTAFWFDIVSRKMVEYRFAEDRETVHDLPFMASMLAVIDDDRQLVAADDGLYIRRVSDGSLARHCPLEADNPATRSNDGRVHPSGALWIGTMGRKAEPEAGAIYWYRGGELRMLFPNIGIPNAISFSADGRLAHYTDTQKGVVLSVDLDPATGLPAGDPYIFLETGHDAGDPDGAIIDRGGAMWCARWGAARLSAFGRDGAKLRSLALPASNPTCPAFVGRNLDRLLVTSARQGLSEDDLESEPLAGRTFLLDVEVPGRAEPHVLL